MRLLLSCQYNSTPCILLPQLLDASAVGLGNTPQHKNMRPSRKASQLAHWGKPGYVDLEQQNQDGLYGDAGLMSLVDYLDSEADILPSASGFGALGRLGPHPTPDTYPIKQEVGGLPRLLAVCYVSL